jgi:hypothetical protein
LTEAALLTAQSRNSSRTFELGARLNPHNRHTAQPTRSVEMGKIVVSQNMSLDGVVQDPTGEGAS